MRTLLFLLASAGLAAQEPSFGFDAPANEETTLDTGIFGAPTLDWSGLVSLRTRGFYLEEKPWRGGLEALPETRLVLEGSSGQAQMKASFQINPEILENDPASVMVEAWARYNMDLVFIEAGLLKPAWGRADGLRVLDVLNPMDRTDFIHPDLIDQKMAQPMLRTVWIPDPSFRVEAVWTPWLEGDKLATTGRWVPRGLQAQLDHAYSQFYAGFKAQYEGQIYAAAFTQAMGAGQSAAVSHAIAMGAVTSQQALITSWAHADAQAMVADLFRYPDPLRWGNSQAGLRLSGTAGGFDWGLQYWYGFLRLPSADLDPSTATGIHALLSYDRVHHFGLDAALNVFGFGLRAEGAFDLTEDWEGGNRLVRNSSVSWSFGLDRDWGGLTVVAEARQKILVNHNQISHPFDVELGSRLHDTLVLLRLSQNLMQDTFSWEVMGLYSIEDVDGVFSPALVWKPGDFEVSLTGYFYGGRDTSGNFSQFYDQNFLELTVSYRF